MLSCTLIHDRYLNMSSIKVMDMILKGKQILVDHETFSNVRFFLNRTGCDLHKHDFKSCIVKLISINFCKSLNVYFILCAYMG